MQTMNTYAIINGFTDQVHDTRDGLRYARISRDVLNTGKGWRRKDGGDNRQRRRRQGDRRLKPETLRKNDSRVSQRRQTRLLNRRENERRQPMQPQPGRGFHLARPGGWRT